jgi:hypothetical protein
MKLAPIVPGVAEVGHLNGGRTRHQRAKQRSHRQPPEIDGNINFGLS